MVGQLIFFDIEPMFLSVIVFGRVHFLNIGGEYPFVAVVRSDFNRDVVFLIFVLCFTARKQTHRAEKPHQNAEDCADYPLCRFHNALSSLFAELIAIQFRIQSPAFDELFMRAALGNDAVRHDEDFVRVFDGR